MQDCGGGRKVAAKRGAVPLAKREIDAAMKARDRVARLESDLDRARAEYVGALRVAVEASSISAVARALGISRQRVQQLARR